MFGLGLWEWVGIIIIAGLLFGPRFLIGVFTSVWKSLKGFFTSFNQATQDPALSAEPEKKALPGGH